PIAPPTWVRDVIAYAESVMPLEKVRMGLHFYGYSWQRSRGNVVTWRTVHTWVENFDLTIERDEHEATFLFDAPGLPARTIYIADGENLAYKLDFILTDYPALGGVAIWGLGGEDPAMWDILREMEGSC